jgi:hypothetical protein
MTTLIDGFDYRTHQPVSLTREAWQAEITSAIRAGGRRRVENGETFLHGPNARLIAEIYARVPAPTPEVRRGGRVTGER